MTPCTARALPAAANPLRPSLAALLVALALACGLSEAVDAWIVGLDVTCQLTVMAGVPFLIALALHNLTDHAATNPPPRPADRQVCR